MYEVRVIGVHAPSAILRLPSEVRNALRSSSDDGHNSRRQDCVAMHAGGRPCPGAACEWSQRLAARVAPADDRVGCAD